MPLDMADHLVLARAAVKQFWTGRSGTTNGESTPSQGGERSNVLGGKNMDGFLGLIEALVRRNGLPQASVHTQSRADLTLPGYFRPTKMWDVVVISQEQLVAAIELKSQVGSFGNNFNNRTEEAIGTAHDLWTAFREEALGDQSRPFLGWLMLVEDSPKSRKPVRDRSPHFPIFEDFKGASYLDRYEVLCRRLIQESLYTQASLLVSSREEGQAGGFGEMSRTTNLTAFAAGLAGHAAAWAETQA